MNMVIWGDLTKMRSGEVRYFLKLTTHKFSTPACNGKKKVVPQYFFS